MYARVYILRLSAQWLEMPIVVLEFLGGLLNMLIFGPELRGAPCALLLDALVVPTVMAGKAKSPMMRYLHLVFVRLLTLLGLDMEVGHEYGPFNPVADAGSRGKLEELEAIMANLNLAAVYITVPPEAIQLIDDAYAEWSRIGAAARAAELADEPEREAQRRHRGGDWPAAPAAIESVRPVSEEERQVGRSRLNSDSSGPSPYVERGDDDFTLEVPLLALPAPLAPGVPGRPQRTAAVVASVKIGDTIEEERGGEDKHTRSSEAASRQRDAGRAALPPRRSSLSTPAVVTATRLSNATVDTVGGAIFRSYTDREAAALGATVGVAAIAGSPSSPPPVVLDAHPLHLAQVAASYTPAGLEGGLHAPSQRVGVTAAGATSAAASGAAVAFVPLPFGSTSAAASCDAAADAAVSSNAAGKRAKRRRRCGTCAGCTSEECGACTFCRDMPKRGGLGVMRKGCMRRMCMFMLAVVGDAFSLGAAPSARAALAMAPLSLAPLVTGTLSARDFLMRRAGVDVGVTVTGLPPLPSTPAALAPRSGFSGGALAAPAPLAGTVPRLPAAASAPTSARDFLVARATPASQRPHAFTTSAASWAATGAPAVALGDGASASALRRRAMGLAVLHDEPDRREALATRMHEALAHGYAPSTAKIDEGYWARWEAFCKSIGTSPWRVDMAANSGMDPEGHQEEVFLLASAMLHFYENMHPRRNSDPAASPVSAKKIIESIARTHFTRGIKMVDLKVVSLACKGMCREYIDAYGVDTLVPERKLPFTDSIITDIFKCHDGATRGSLTVDWSAYYWIAVDACFETLAEEGSRKDEVAKKSAATPFRKGRFTFASLAWHIDGKDLLRPPTRAELLTLKPGDGVLLKHGISKNDPFGSYFAATPSFLAYREGDARCACRALARLELEANVAPARRGLTPLFGPAPGEEFTHHQLDKALELLLVEGAGVAEEELSNFSVHSFRIFVACALLEAKAPRWLIKRMLRWRGDESLEVYARLNNTTWAEWTGKLLDVAVQSTVSARLNHMDFSEETRTRFNDVARSMLSMSTGTARRTTGTL